MSRTVYRCIVNLTLNEVSAPGVRLFCREDVYLTVSLFGQYYTTSFMKPDFNLLVYESFRFEKTFYSALEFSELEDYLNDELIIFELVQLSDYSDGAVRLASFSTRVKDILQPFPLRPYFSSSADHEVMLARTIAFNGISPKLSFSTRTMVKESLSPELDALEDAMQEEKEQRIFMKTHRVPTPRVRSVPNARPSSSVCVVRYVPTEDDPPPRHRQHTKSSRSRCRSASTKVTSAFDIDLSNSADHRPDFVVRSLSGGAISHVPGFAEENVNTNASKKDKGQEIAKEKESSSSEKKKKKKKKKRTVGECDIVVGVDQPLCAACRAYRKATGRPCIGKGSFHHGHGHSGHFGPCLCSSSMKIYNIHHHQPVHVYISDDEDDVAVAYRKPRTGSGARYFAPRSGYYGPVPPPQISLMMNKSTERVT